MFHYIEGIVDELMPPNLAVLDCAGLGFALNVSSNTLAVLRPGEKARLYTYVYLREDALELFGFAGKNEKRSFEQLIGISGVGPKAALSILSYNTPEALALAIASGNEKALTVVPGIGKKIAQRVLLELKDKVAGVQELAVSQTGGSVPAAVAADQKVADAAAALAVLGYGTADIHEALRNIDTASLTLEAVIKAALKNMVRWEGTR